MRLRRRKPKTREEALANIRRHSAALGAPLDDKSDEEIEASLRRAVEMFSRAGMTMAEASNGLAQAAAAFGRAVPHRP